MLPRPAGSDVGRREAAREVSRSARRKVRGTFYVSTELLEEARDAAVHLSGPPLYLTLTGLVETALRLELEHLRATFTGGKAFPRRQRDLQGGRPIGPRPDFETHAPPEA